MVSAYLFFLGSYDKKSYQPYQLSFYESVSGLDVGSPVKYFGVKVGKVKDILVAGRRYVKVLISVESNIKITDDIEGTIKTQGMTGIHYIELVPTSKEEGKELITNPYHIAEIKTKPSLITELSVVLSALSADMRNIVKNLNALFNQRNAKHISNTLASIDTISTDVSKGTQHLDGMLKGVVSLEAQLQTSLMHFDALLKGLEGTNAMTQAMLQELLVTIKQSNQHLDRTFKRVDGNLETLKSTNHVLNLQIETLSDKLVESMRNIDRVMNNLEKKSDSLFLERENSDAIPFKEP